MDSRPLGRTGLRVTPIGLGAFKIGRNVGAKYPQGYELPDPGAVDRLLNGALDLGVNYIDTAPAYGVSEQRIGQCIAHRRSQFVLSSKVGETFEAGRSTFDYTAQAVRDSVQRSLRRLCTDVLDIVLIHSRGDDVAIMTDTDVVATLQGLRDGGAVRAIGLSGKTVQGAHAALEWADVVMVEYHLDDRSHEAVMAEAHAAGVGVVVKKGLGSGRLAPDRAVSFALSNNDVDSLTVGTLSLEHLRQNIATAEAARGGPAM